MGHNKQKDGCIYKIENTENGKVYIGSTINFKARFSAHLSELKRGAHGNYKLQNDWNNYDETSFIIKILDIIPNHYELPYKEKEWIDYYKSRNKSYNLSDPVMDEDIKGRYKKKKEKPKYKIKQRDIVEYMNENFQYKLNDLKTYLRNNFIYEKKTADKWFINNVEDEKVKNELESREALKGWYNKNDLAIVKSPILKKEMRKLGIKDIPNSEIIIEQDLLAYVGSKHRRLMRISDNLENYLIKLNIQKEV